jgi:hypothetical protein
MPRVQHFTRHDKGFPVLYLSILRSEGLWIVERREVAEEVEFALGMSLAKSFQKETAEARAKDLDGQQEFAAAGDPAFVIGRQAAGGNHAVEASSSVGHRPIS